MAIPAIIPIVASVVASVASAADASKKSKMQQREQAKANMEKATQGGVGGGVSGSGTPLDIKGIVNTIKQGIEDVKQEKENKIKESDIDAAKELNSDSNYTNTYEPTTNTDVTSQQITGV